MPHNFTREGTWDESSLLCGDWSEVYVEVAATPYRIGNVPEGVLEIGREFLEHIDTSFPKTTDLIIQTRVWMKFTGTVEEINDQNVSWLLGQTMTPTSNYLYIGDLNVPVFFSFYGRRLRPVDGAEIAFKIHKALVRSLFSVGSGAEWVGSPLEIEGLNDSDGDYGGSITDPLGWIWVPDQGS